MQELHFPPWWQARRSGTRIKVTLLPPRRDFSGPGEGARARQHRQQLPTRPTAAAGRARSPILTEGSGFPGGRLPRADK
jgi:hypothetical protein